MSVRHGGWLRQGYAFEHCRTSGTGCRRSIRTGLLGPGPGEADESVWIGGCEGRLETMIGDADYRSWPRLDEVIRRDELLRLVEESPAPVGPDLRGAVLVGDGPSDDPGHNPINLGRDALLPLVEAYMQRSHGIPPPWITPRRSINLRNARLEQANLQKANLQEAYLSRAHLHRADLRRSQLQGASLGGARLEGANLAVAKLQGAYLRRAMVERANLAHANLQGADLNGAQLRRAILTAAELQGAYLDGAQLREADLRRAKLRGAHLAGTQL